MGYRPCGKGTSTSSRPHFLAIAILAGAVRHGTTQTAKSYASQKSGPCGRQCIFAAALRAPLPFVATTDGLEHSPFFSTRRKNGEMNAHFMRPRYAYLKNNSLLDCWNSYFNRIELSALSIQLHPCASFLPIREHQTSGCPQRSVI